MFRIFGESKLLTIAKYIAVLITLVFMAIIVLLIVKKNDPKIPQREVIINLELEDKTNINKTRND